MLPLVLVLFGMIGCAGDDGPDAREAEVCDNGADDDLDGRADCADSDCWSACAEVCDDGVDNDGDGLVDCDDQGCDGQCDEVCDDGRDNDLDGIIDCEDPDCDGLCPEDCSNGVDDDDDGSVDCDDSDCDTTCDADGDGHASTALGGDDCDDANPAINPSADEVCNKGIDDDCDGDADDADGDVVDAADWWVDDDVDGYGDDLQRLSRCEQLAGTAPAGGDCDDDNPNVNPGITEICNGGTDDDCNGYADDDDPLLDLSTLIAWFDDNDFDGFGSTSVPVLQCDQPFGRADNDIDCDDNDPFVGGMEPWLDDIDGDGYGSGAPSASQCTSPAPGWVRESNGVDCDDADPFVSPGSPEICSDGIDQDCDGVDFTACNDTAADWNLYGGAVVDPAADTYIGTEIYEFMGQSTGWLVCEWTFTVLDWANDPTVVGPDPFTAPCTDPDGNPCDWAYTVHMSNGTMTGGTDCAFYGLTPALAGSIGPYGYGWTDNYEAFGYSYGPQMMYHNPYNPSLPPSAWVAVDLLFINPTTSSYDPVSDDFLYDWGNLATVPTP